MAKILVADDNSNIQKMVSLALKDQGIDVVAVGNGEAAVRKISDVRPDLVLADVFMPVRNGYEVCQYVKTNSALSHIPVILLVGAFDPLDEQEAQRVGADGVLKKPFVPPDPLISMVKSALARAGVSISGAPTQPPPLQAAEMISPRPGPASVVFREIPSIAPQRRVPTVDSEPVQDPIPARPEPVKIEPGSQPLAFGSLLESPAKEEEDLSFIAPGQSPTAPDRDWGAKDEEEVAEDEEEGVSSAWRPDAVNEAFVEEETTGPAKEARRHHPHAWAPDKEKTGFVEAAETDEKVSAVVTETAVPEAKAPTPAAPYAGDMWNAASTPGTNQAKPQPQAGSQTEPKIEAPAPGPEKPAADSWYSAASSPWDGEAQKANQLASAWDVPAASAPAPSETRDVAEPAEMTFVEEEGPAESAAMEEAVLPASTVEAIREEAAHLAESAFKETPAAKPGEEPEESPEATTDDLVAKVLAKLSPEMLQAVTREILKPVVAAIVREELNNKK